MSLEPEIAVTYTVKDLLNRLDGKIDGLFVALGAKADKAELDDLRRQLTEVKLEQARSGGVREWFWRLLAAVPGVIALIAMAPHS